LAQGPAPHASTEAQVNALINALYGPTRQGAAHRDFARIKALVAGNRTDDVQQSIVAFVGSALAAFANEELQDPNGASPPSIADALRDLINSVAEFGGMAPPIPPSNPLGADGAVKVVGPGGGTVVTSSGFGGVQFPPNALASDVIVVMERLPNPTTPKTGPLPTTKDQYPLFYDLSTSPAVAQFAQPVLVGICQLAVGAPLGPPTLTVANRLQLAHPTPATPSTIELLAREAASFIACGGASGVGGRTTSFSPFGAVDPGAVDPVVTGQAIAAGSHHACVLTNSGSAYCWGINEQSQLGASTTTTCTAIPCSRAPVAVSGGFTFQTIDAGGDATCGLVSGGTVRCWGANTKGQLGNGSFSNSAMPVAVAGSSLASVSVGASHACALTPGGVAWCWGSNTNNELGATSAGSCLGACSATPLAVTGDLQFGAISVGSRHSCGLTSAGAAYCWGGTDGVGLLGNGTLAGLAPSPTAVSGGLTMKELVSDGPAVCALTTGGQAYCWGTNSVGQLGDGTTIARTVPTPVSGGLTFARLATTAGQNSFLSHMCGITTEGAAYCWGANNLGQLGGSRGTMCNFGVPTPCELIPVPVSGGLTWRELAVGQAFTCGITISKVIYCWGSNETGQLGSGTFISSSPIPRLVSGGLSPP
jgi:alpha-tubulin suppressor-like RCC1 family protein